MRRTVVLLLLLGLMSGVSVLQAEATTTVNPLTLAAIGFVVLASFSAAELGARLGLPRVTGYIVSGLILGPSALNILAVPVVTEMKMFNTLALGLIATAAGLELDLGQLRAVARTLIATTAVKVLLAVPAVAITAWLLLGWVDVPGGAAGRLALAIIMGTLAIGTSPSITLAVLRETGARGRVADLTLGAAALKDVVVVVALALATATGTSLLSGAAIEVALVGGVVKEVVLSILAGAVLGAFTIAYIRWIHSEMLLFISAMVLVVAEVAGALHLELLLVFLTAGFVVRNFSRFEHALAHPLEMVSMPVFIVFFTIAGASVDAGRTASVIPLALGVFVVRAGTFWIAARVGGRWGSERAPVLDNAWLAYLPQAGVTLGLVGLAAQRLPVMAETIQTIGMAIVALNLLAGPVALRAALGRAGELPAPTPAPAPGQADAATEAATDGSTADDEEPAPPPEREELLARAAAGIDDLDLAATLRTLVADLDSALQRALDDTLAPWAAGMTRSVGAALGLADEAATLRRWAQAPHGEAVISHGIKVRGLFDEMRARLRSLPDEREVATQPDELEVTPRTDLRVRMRLWRARWQRTLTGRLPPRRVPVRASARMVLEPRLARICTEIIGTVARAQGGCYEVLRAHAQEQMTAEDARRGVSKRMSLLVLRLRADVRRELGRGADALAAACREAGGPRLPTPDVRFSRVEFEVRTALRQLAEEPPAWRDRLAGAQHALLLAVELRTLRGAADAALDRHLISPAAEALGGVRQVVVGVRHSLKDALEQVRSHQSTPASSLAEWGENCNLTFSQKGHRAIESRLHAFRANASLHRVSVELRTAMGHLPERGAVVPGTTPISRAVDPAAVALVQVDIREDATEHLIHGMLSEVDERMDTMSRLLANTAPRLREAMDIALYAVESRADGAEGDAVEDLPGLIASFERALARIDKLEAEIGDAATGLRAITQRTLSSAFARLDATLSDAQGPRGAAVVDAALGGARQAASRLWAPARAWWERERDRSVTWWRELRESRFGTELRARTAEGRLDAVTLRSHTDHWLVPEGIPEGYARLFSLQPVREHRLFTAWRPELEAIRRAERAWLEGDFGSVLVVGAHGSGRTSLLNLTEVELAVPRVVRPEPSSGWRDSGLDAALAQELGCRAQRRSVLKALRKVRTAVLLDDLEQWFTPDEAGLRALTSFLDLLQRSRDTVFWIATTTHAALRLCEESTPVRASFARVLEFGPLPHDQVRAAILTRHALSGRDLIPARPLPLRVLGRLSGTDEVTWTFRVLTRLSDGNLSKAMTLWLRAVELVDDHGVTPQTARMLSVGLPPFRELDPIQIGMLLAVLRWGGASPRRLAESLGVAPHVVAQHANFLRAAGLLEPQDARRDELRVPKALVGPVVHGLRDVGTEP